MLIAAVGEQVKGRERVSSLLPESTKGERANCVLLLCHPHGDTNPLRDYLVGVAAE